MRFNPFLALVSVAVTVSALPSNLLVQQEAFPLDRWHTIAESGDTVPTPFPISYDDEGNVIIHLEEQNMIDEAMFDDWKNLVVSSHNKFRTRYGAPNLSWSDALYPDTLKWAQQCKFQHRLV
jgi:hypothetical protein